MEINWKVKEYRRIRKEREEERGRKDGAEMKQRKQSKQEPVVILVSLQGMAGRRGTWLLFDFFIVSLHPGNQTEGSGLAFGANIESTSIYLRCPPHNFLPQHAMHYGGDIASMILEASKLFHYFLINYLDQISRPNIPKSDKTSFIFKKSGPQIEKVDQT